MKTWKLICRKEKRGGAKKLSSLVFALEGTVTISLFLAHSALSAEISPSFTYQGKLFNAAGTAPVMDIVNFKFSIYDPSGTCLLYEEVQSNVDLVNTAGVFAVRVGSTTNPGRRTTNDPGLSMKNVFSNQSSLAHAARPTCPSGYTPSSGDSRKLRVTVTPDSTGIPSTLVPDLVIGSQPSALVAQSLQGFEPQEFLRSASGATGQGNVSLSTLSVLTSFEDASALHHHDSLYIKRGSSIDLNSGSTAFTVGSLGVGTSLPTSAISFGGSVNRSIEVQRNPTIGSSGSSLALSAGGASSGSTNQSGGNLILSSGTATGNAGSQIEFQTAQGGSSGSSDQPSVTKMVLSALGKLGLGSLSPEAQLEVIASSPSVTGQVIQGSTSQVAPLLKLQDSSGNTLSYFDASGHLTLPGNPSQATQAATKNYVDTQITASLGGIGAVNSFNSRTGSISLLGSDVTEALTYTPLRKSGDTITGSLILNADPTESLGAATRQFVLTALAGKQDSGSFLTALSGDVTASGPGSVSAAVNSVGGVASGQIASAATSVAGATSSSTADTLVKRDPAGNFSAATITAQLSGNVVGNLTGNVTGSASMNVLKSGDTMSGLLVLSGDPQAPLGAATKGYVDLGLLTKQASLGFVPVNRVGDTMSGSLILSGNSTFGLGQYSDAQEVTLSASLSTSDEGTTWYNVDSNTIKYWNGNAIQTLGISGAGVQSINGLTTNTQSLANGISGNSPNWNSSGSTHTLNIPLANQSASVTAGLLSNADYVSFSNKQSALGYIPLNLAGGSMTGDLLLTPTSPTEPLQAVNKQYVDTGLAGKQSLGNYISGLSGDVSALGPDTASATVNSVGGVSSSAIAGATGIVSAATASNTPSTLVKRDASGNFSAGAITANLTGNVVGNVTGNLTGNVTGSASLNLLKSGDTMTGPLTLAENPTSGLNAASKQYVDTGLAGKQSLGNYISGLSGDVSALGPDTASAMVNSVGGVSSSAIAGATAIVSAATSSNTPDTLVRRDSTGNLSAGTITATLSGNVVGNVTGNLAGDVTGNLTGNLTGNVTGSASLNLLKSGDTMSGSLFLPSNGLMIGTDQFVASNDRIGIGTQAPALKLDVSGSAIFRGPTVGGVGGELYYDSTNNVYKYYNSTAWQTISNDLSSCPTGMVFVGTGRSKYCIDTTARTAANHYNAIRGCFNAGYWLCNYAEWTFACDKLGGTFVRSGAEEWVADPYGQYNNTATRASSGTGCWNLGMDIQTNTARYRCCTR